MKVYERFNQIGAFGDLKTVDKILNFVYQHRIYINDVLEEEFPQDISNAAEKFMENDKYDGDELKAWERFLNSEMDY